MARRRSVTSKERLRLFALHGGICHICEGKIDATKEAWEVSHDIPLELGGNDDDANRKPAHKKCHRALTASVDIPNIARAKRREAKNLGAKSPSSRGFRKPKDMEFDWSRGRYVRRTP